MGITVADIMALPCLEQARVAAGKKGLDKVVSSVSVLEFANFDVLQKEFFEGGCACGGEIILTSFAGIANDVSLQCASISRLAKMGCSGLILYYVGICVPAVDQKLIEEANRLEFALLVMPTNRADLHYGEVINEVSKAIFEEQSATTSPVGDVLGQMCDLQDSAALAQTMELIKVAASLWETNHNKTQTSELVQAILRDEPLKMRRLADLFHIDVASIHSMWIMRCDNNQQELFERCGLKNLREDLAHYCDTVVADVYEGYLVAFIAWPDKTNIAPQLEASSIKRMEEASLEVTLTCCYQLCDTADARQAFILNRNYVDDARCIWPKKRIYTLGEIEFAKRCRAALAASEASLEQILEPLNALGTGKESGEFRRTLAVYLLDAESSVTCCASLLFLHKNTIKYRLGRLKEYLGYPVDKMPEKFYLYRGVAAMRLVEKGE